MKKRITLISLMFLCLLLFSSCNVKDEGNRLGDVFMSEDKKVDARLEQIVLALKDKDSEALKSLFSEKALNEAIDIDNEISYLFDLISSDIVSWERDDGLSSDTSIEYGKKTLMLRYGFNVKTDEEVYDFFVIDYAIDTINSDNEGIYMLEVRLEGSPNTGSWQDRMRAGIYIH